MKPLYAFQYVIVNGEQKCRDKIEYEIQRRLNRNIINATTNSSVFRQRYLQRFNNNSRKICKF